MPTLKQVLISAEKRFLIGPHPERARADAEMLLRAALARDKAWLHAHLFDGMPAEVEDHFGAMVERRFAGEPVQHIVGETEFYGLPFRVTRDALIPRPETEHLVEKVIALAAEMLTAGNKQARIVDVGTGSGAIAIALAAALPSAQITAVDVSEAALLLARENSVINRVDARIRFLHGDLLATVAREQFDMVVSNPPYVPTIDQTTLSVEVRDYEPALALFAGNDGLDVYKRLIPAAFAALRNGGAVALEIGYGQAEIVEALLTAEGFSAVEFVPDLQGIARVACARRP